MHWLAILWTAEWFRKAIKWAARITGVLLVSWAATAAIMNFSSWVFRHFSNIFTSARVYMDVVGDEIQSFTSTTGSSFWDALVYKFEVGFFVQSLIGWGAFFVSLIETTLIGVGILFVVYALKLIVLKWKQKLADSISS